MRPLLLLLLSFSFATAQPIPSEAHRTENIKRWEEIASSSPKDPEAWHTLAGFYRDGSLWQKAIAAETQSLQIFPKYAVAYHGRAQARMGAGDYAGAVQDFTACINLYEARGGLEKYLTVEQPRPEYIDSYRTRGVAQAHLGKFDLGIDDVSIAMKLKKDDPRLHFERGHLEEKARRTPAAIADFHRAGLLYIDQGSLQGAQECIERLKTLAAKSQASSLVARIEARKKPHTDLP